MLQFQLDEANCSEWQHPGWTIEPLNGREDARTGPHT